jgi:hypothetical protein
VPAERRLTAGYLEPTVLQNLAVMSVGIEHKIPLGLSSGLSDLAC